MLIFWRKSSDVYGLFVSLLLTTFGAIGVSDALGIALEWAYPDWHPILSLTSLVFPLLGFFLVTLPDGRLVPRWSVVVVGLWVVQALFWDIIDLLPIPIFALELLIVFGSTLAVQVYRYRRVLDATQRQQVKWVVLGFTFSVASIAVTGLLSIFDSRLADLAEGTQTFLIFTPLPVTIGLAILRYRLWDIDALISRTLIYGALTASIIGIYTIVVGYLGAVFQTSDNLAISLTATGLVAVLFQPLRDRLQILTNRLVYGERDEPYAVLSRLGRRLEATLAPEAVLPTVVQTVAGALKLPYVALAEPTTAPPPHAERAEGYTIIAEWPLAGRPISSLVHLPVPYQAETIGWLLLAPRSPGEGFSSADQRLLADLARQAGNALHAVRLTSELRQVAVDLQQARERLVTTREEERRRLRRDLHDGLGPTLAGLTFTLEAARNLLCTQSDRVDELLVSAGDQTQFAITEIRRLVYALRPPALDELGLLGALQQEIAKYGGVAIALETPQTLPPLPAAVEVAVYRIVQEAITNVMRHAQARHCRVRLVLTPDVGTVTQDTLVIEIIDDGLGLPLHHRVGAGLYTMRERAEELGGALSMERNEPQGVRVRAVLPLTVQIVPHPG